MNRPYDIDQTGTIHWQTCQLDYDLDGDSTREGVLEGLANHGEGLCPKCIDDDARGALLEAAAKYV